MYSFKKKSQQERRKKTLSRLYWSKKRHINFGKALPMAQESKIYLRFIESNEINNCEQNYREKSMREGRVWGEIMKCKYFIIWTLWRKRVGSKWSIHSHIIGFGLKFILAKTEGMKEYLYYTRNIMYTNKAIIHVVGWMSDVSKLQISLWLEDFNQLYMLVNNTNKKFYWGKESVLNSHKSGPTAQLHPKSWQVPFFKTLWPSRI